MEVVLKVRTALRKPSDAAGRTLLSWSGDEERSMFRSVIPGKELVARRRQFPKTWQIGEDLADDRFAILRAEDRPWSVAMADEYMSEVGRDAVMIVLVMATQQHRAIDSDRLTTLTIACGLRLEVPLLNYIRSGWADIDRRAIRDHRANYDDGRHLAEITFGRASGPWFESAPVICAGILRQFDVQFRAELDTHTFRPPFGPLDTARCGFQARMAEMVRARLSEALARGQDDPVEGRELEADQQLREMSWSAGPRRARRYLPARS